MASIAAVVALTAGCTQDARQDLAESAFVKAVNLKCKVSKAEFSLAWNLADELGADDKGRELAGQATEQTDELLAEIDRLDGPADIRKDVERLFEQSSVTLQEMADGTVSLEDGRARLEELRQEARDRGLGECVSI